MHPTAPLRPLSLLRPQYHRFHTCASRRTAWSPGPAPPRLPKDEQEIYEQLQRQSTGAFSTPRVNQAPQDGAAAASSADVDASAAQQAAATSATTDTYTSSREPIVEGKITAQGKGEELHPHVRRGAPPEFEGDVNPQTGEVGGPKNNPLRWGGGVDWSYNGRVSDF